MNTLCQNCGRVDLLGHHICRMDGDDITVRKTIAGMCGIRLKSEGRLIYSCGKLIPCSVHGHSVRVSPRSVDSAIPRPYSPTDDFYGLSIPITNPAARARLQPLVESSYKAYKAMMGNTLEQINRDMLDPHWKPGWKYRVIEWIQSKLVRR